MTCVQQIAFPLGLSDLERFNQRQLRYPTIVLLQLTLARTASFKPSSFLQDFFPFLQSNRSHNRARSPSNQSIARLFFFFKLKRTIQRKITRSRQFQYYSSIRWNTGGREKALLARNADSLPRIDNFLRGENNGIFHRLLIGAEQTIAWSWFREIRPRSEKFSWKGEARVALYVVNYERERSHETSSVHVRASREIPIRSRARV